MKWYFMADAEQELKEAKAYYEREKRGLGKQFLLEVRKAIRRILKFPKAGIVNGSESRWLALTCRTTGTRTRH
jgi:hypothetical protein